ncbi:MAG: polyprenyl synthetase family protein [Anaerolineales bacterium]|nr:polyprenyl synthetase family protein [Anaerolineales bacterium]
MLHITPQDLRESMIPAIENQMHQIMTMANEPELEPFYSMMAYHLGWEGKGAGPEARGKRFRPLLLLLTCVSAGGGWEKALPAAAAVELLHNFSLIHDDIQDNSPLRRGRETVWKIWGIPQAINAGDAMLTLAHLAMLNLENTVTSDILTTAVRLLQQTCLKLTKGQYLDMTFEKCAQVTLEEYWQMVEGKTAALISVCAELGALIAGASESVCQYYKDFGHFLGLAFQAQDDLLGIWGDAAITGKSNESDLVSGKKTLPVLYGVSQEGEFSKRWLLGNIRPAEVHQIAAQLENEGGLAFTRQETERLTKLALDSFYQAEPQEPAKGLLIDIAEKLLHRNG